MPTKKLHSEDESFQAQSQSEESMAGNYSVITYKDRIRLIQMVCLEKMQILEAAKKLNIRVSTAKYILRCFRRQGKILKKNLEQEANENSYKQQVQLLRKKIQSEQVCKNKKKVEKPKKQTKKMEKASIFQTKFSIQQPIQQKILREQEEIIVKNEPNIEKINPINGDSQNIIYFFFFSPMISPIMTESHS